MNPRPTRVPCSDRWIVAAFVTAIGLLLPGCDKRVPARPPEKPANPAEKQRPGAHESTGRPTGQTSGNPGRQPSEPPRGQDTTPRRASRWRADRFCVMAIQVTSATPEKRLMTAVAPNKALVRRALTRVPELSGVRGVDGAGCASATVAEQVGVAVTLDYAGASATRGLIRPDHAEPDDRLYVSATAHVERAGPDAKAEVAQSTVEASGPLVKADAAGMTRRIHARLEAAATLAVRRALGQLWIRHQTDAEVQTALQTTDPWRRAAALREVGERGLIKAVATVEAATRNSLADLAVVACATLGRLGQQRSVDALASALSSAPLEVADAALYALHDIGGQRATALIRAAANGHAAPWIRLRAKALLDAGTAGR